MEMVKNTLKYDDMKRMISFFRSNPMVLLLLAALAVVCDYVFGGGLLTATGISLAVAGVAVPADGGGNVQRDAPLDTGTTEKLSPEMLEKDIYEKVIKVRPGNTPIDTITRMVKRQKAKAQKCDFYAMGVLPTNTTLKTAVSLNDTANAVATLEVTDAGYFDTNDTILVPSVTGNDGAYLMLYVQKMTDENKPVVLAVNTDEHKMPAISQNAELIRMGLAGAEKDAQCSVMQGVPNKSENYCQVFEKQCEETEFHKLTSKEVKWEMTDIEEHAVYDMKRGMEYSLMFGVKGMVYDTQKKEDVYSTMGMWWQAQSEFAYTASADFGFKDLTALSKKVFTGNNGGSRRILFAGADLLEMLQNVEVKRVLTNDNEYTKLGMTFDSIVTKFGRMEVIHAEIFDQMGMPGNGFVLDPENVVRKEFIPFRRKILDLEKSGQRNVMAVFLQEVCCINLFNPATHCRIVAE